MKFYKITMARKIAGHRYLYAEFVEINNRTYP